MYQKGSYTSKLYIDNMLPNNCTCMSLSSVLLSEYAQSAVCPKQLVQKNKFGGDANDLKSKSKVYC